MHCLFFQSVLQALSIISTLFFGFHHLSSFSSILSFHVLSIHFLILSLCAHSLPLFLLSFLAPAVSFFSFTPTSSLSSVFYVNLTSMSVCILSSVLSLFPSLLLQFHSLSLVNLSTQNWLHSGSQHSIVRSTVHLGNKCRHPLSHKCNSDPTTFKCTKENQTPVWTGTNWCTYNPLYHNICNYLSYSVSVKLTQKHRLPKGQVQTI